MKHVSTGGRSHMGGLSRGQFAAIVCSFWVYATLSDVMYAYGMRTGIARVTDVPLFAEWGTRVLQHMLLLPLLLISFWASLRIQWRPLWIAGPLQIVLGGVFAATGYPAMMIADLASHGGWQSHIVGHGLAQHVFSEPVLSFWAASFASLLPTYGFGLTLVTGLVLYTRFQKAELQVAALEKEWSAARLTALRMQLSPHTLFNLLHTIRGYIDWDPKDAQVMVVQLADLLRRLLNAGERDFSRLIDELHFVRLYLELQQRRFSDRLTIVLPEPREQLSLWVPSLILQPLVENAVVHGLAGHQGAVVVRVATETASGVLTLRVSNTLAHTAVAHPEGIGLKNVRERLSVQFGGRAALLACPQHGEWVSTINMPEIHVSPDRRATIRVASVDA